MSGKRFMSSVLRVTFVLLLAAGLTACVTESSKPPVPGEPKEEAGQKTDTQNTPVETTEKDEQALRDRALTDYITLATGYLREGKRDQALRALKKGIELDDDSPALLNVLALYYSTDSEFELAEKQYRKAISADSSYTASYLNYGVFLYERQRYQDALEMFRKACDDVMYSEREIAFLNYGLALKKLGHDAEAETYFKRSIANNPRNPRAILEMVQLEFDRGNFAESRMYYEQFIKLSRQTPRSLWLGIRLMKVFGEDDRLASYALFLKNQYPASREYLEYKAWSEAQ